MNSQQASKKLTNLFPGTDDKTKLVVLGLGTNILEGKSRVEVAQYNVGAGEYIHAGYSKQTNTIYIRLVQEKS